MLVQLTTSIVQYGQHFEPGEQVNLPTAEARRFLERNMAVPVAPVVDLADCQAFDCPHCAGRCQLRTTRTETPSQAATAAAAEQTTQAPTERAENAGNTTRSDTARVRQRHSVSNARQ